jgi:hypothetical protein
MDNFATNVTPPNQLVHFLKESGLSSISPDLHTPYAFIGSSNPQSSPDTGRHSKYITTLAPEQKLYDLSTDTLGLAHNSLEDCMWDPDSMVKTLRDHGFVGMFNSSSSRPEVVKMFQTVNPQTEHRLGQ